MPAKIHIVQLAPILGAEPPQGGVERFVEELCLSLDKDRFAITVCAFKALQISSSGQVIDDLRAAGCEVYTGAAWDARHNSRNLWNAYQQLKTFLRDKPVDIIHSHSPRLDVAALLLSRQSRAGLVRTIASPYEWPNRPLMRLLVFHLAYPLFFHEVGVNQTLVDNLDKRPIARLLKRHAHQINNAVNLGRFQGGRIDKKAKKQALGLPSDSVIIGSVGRLSEQKGYAYFIQAARQVIDEVEAPVYFVLVGSGELEKSLRQLSLDLGIEQRFIFTGKRDDVEEVLQIFDLFVSSSLWEGLPTVIMESIASEIPVIATDIAGTKDLIKDGISGWLVPASNPTALAQAIIAALHNPDAAFLYSQRAVPVLQEVTISRVAAQYETLYDQIFAKKGRCR